MKYRTKLQLTFSGLIFASVILLATFSYYETKYQIFQLLRSKVISICATGATLLNVDDITALKLSLDENSPEYNAVTTKLKKILSANKSDATFVSAVYLLSQDPKNPKQLIFIADGLEKSEINYAPPGLVYPEGAGIGILNHLRTPYSPSGSLQTDRWGEFYPGYVPIFNSDNQYVATLGVDLLAQSILLDLKKLHWITINGIGIAIALGLIGATVLAGQVTQSLNRICEKVTKIGKGEFGTRIEIETEDEFGGLAKEINQMAVGLQERDHLKVNFVRYVSKHIMDLIIQGEKLPALKGEKKEITLLFSDLRHFTQLSENLPPEKVVYVLNQFLSKMIDVIFENNGTLDKFMGDGLMIEFGAPLDDPEHEKNAVATAIKMHQALEEVNDDLAKQNLPKMEMIIGIHSGPAVMGNIGSDKRMEYTAIGNTVNIASRIEEAAKPLGIDILISETTWMKVKDQFRTKDLGLIELRGKTEPVHVYSVEFSKTES